ncbi:hypothetical protein B0H34DRAFT_99246 [Crassisporium funariophilum]|nr:hypothetical protein B0H34DRAFT_99246 [Crassisporium funariophilum]
MNMSRLSMSLYALDSTQKVNWSITQEKAISTEYPFDLQAETVEQYVARTYLQFLWLPQSIMPLHLLAPSLQRVNAPSTSSDASVHPLHAFLDPLLLETRTCTNKYHVELPQILSDGGGAGEMEETMMWYALTHEKADDEDWKPASTADGPWADEKWRQRYLERMERREVQIQILLHFLKLSLPGPLPSPPEPIKKPKRGARKPDIQTPTTEDRLEAFMDKLSMWQLVGALDPVYRPVASAERKEERDWIQIFTEDVVEQQFKNRLPEECALLRSKVFPNSVFSDDDASNASTSRNPSVEPDIIPPNKSLSRFPSPALSTSSRTTTKSKSTTSSLVRSRSRSLSVSLAQEQERERAASVNPPKKRVLNREVSMSRVFKPKPKPRPTVDARLSKPEVLAPQPKTKVNHGVTLVDETPVKARVSSTATLTFGQPMFRLGLMKENEQSSTSSALSPQERLGRLNEGDEDDEWRMDSSPDILLLNPSQSSGLGSEEDDNSPATPSKPSKKRRQ